VASEGPNGPTAGADDASVGTQAWTNPGNVTAEDATFATANGLPALPSLSHYLFATGFGFTVPDGSTILGILVEWKRKGSTLGHVLDNSVKIVKGGTVQGDEKSTSFAWNTSNVFTSFGAADDLWGLAWTAADIRAANFGAAVSASLDATQTASVDFCRITVTYTPPASVPVAPRSQVFSVPVHPAQIYE
jgi:hypothetical protein